MQNPVNSYSGPGKTKLDHVLDMLLVIQNRGIVFRTVLMDSWYATTDIFKFLIEKKKSFYCPVKANRKIDDTKGKEPYKQMQEAFWSDSDVHSG